MFSILAFGFLCINTVYGGILGHIAYGTCVCATVDGVNARQEAGLYGHIVGSVNDGECYTFNGGIVTKDGDTWYQLQDDQGGLVWVAGSYLQTSTDSDCSGGSSAGQSAIGQANGGAASFTYFPLPTKPPKVQVNGGAASFTYLPLPTKPPKGQINGAASFTYPPLPTKPPKGQINGAASFPFPPLPTKPPKGQVNGAASFTFPPLPTKPPRVTPAANLPFNMPVRTSFKPGGLGGNGAINPNPFNSVFGGMSFPGNQGNGVFVPGGLGGGGGGGSGQANLFGSFQPGSLGK